VLWDSPRKVFKCDLLRICDGYDEPYVNSEIKVDVFMGLPGEIR